MTTLRCGVLILLCSAALPWTAHAADIILDGEGPCLSIGGAWTGGTCTVDRLIVPAGTRLIAVDAVTLSTGDLLVNGALEIWGGFEATRSVENRGTLQTYSYVVITAPTINRGTWQNFNGVRADNTVVNESYFENQSVFETGSGVFVNWGYTVNIPGSYIWNGGGLITNEGLLQNFGYVENPAGSILDNVGAITNYDATIFNYGTALGRCGSAWNLEDLGYGNGLVGNPIAFEPCQPSEAVAALGRSVLAFGQRQMLSKDDTIQLSRLLAKAFKRLELGREAEAVAFLHTFNAEVSARIGFYPIGASLIFRANRALELIANP